MTFEEIVNEVISLLVREDMTFVEDGGDGRIPRAVATALRTMHSKDFFKKDIVKAQYNLPDQAANYVLEIPTLSFPRYRNVSYLRKWDVSLNTALNDISSTSAAADSVLPNLYDSSGFQVIPASLNLLDRIDASDIFDRYHTEKQDIFYLAGDTIFVRSSTILQTLLVGYYEHPYINSANKYAATHTWMMDEYPDVLIQHAANWGFVQIGKQDVARAMTSPNGTLTEQIDILLRSEATEVGI